MKKHHSIVHGESIAGKEFECDFCGKTDRTEPYKLERFDNNFCSSECKYEYLSENQSGKNHHQYERVSVICENCDDETKKHPRTIRREQNSYFCDIECRNEYYRDGNLPTGEQHPSWVGGYDGNYGSTWERIRKEIIELDGSRCKECGKVEESPHVHHIIPVRTFDNANDAHYKENLVTLCEGCHPEIESLERKAQIERLNVPRLEEEV